MDVLVYSALNEQSSLKKQIAEKQKELFDLKANTSGGGAGSYEEAPAEAWTCLLYTSPSPRDLSTSRMPSSA